MSTVLTAGAPSSPSSRRPRSALTADDPLPLSPAVSLLAPSVPATPVVPAVKQTAASVPTPPSLVAADSSSSPAASSSLPAAPATFESPTSTAGPSRAATSPPPEPQLLSHSGNVEPDEGECTARPQKRPRAVGSSRVVSVAAVLEDLADENADQGRVGDQTIFDATQPAETDALEAMLRAAAPSPSVAVCATVYLARLDRTSIPLSFENILALTASALVVASRYVDRENALVATARIAGAVGVTEADLNVLVDRFKQALPDGTYISLASFREFEQLLDELP